MPDTNQGTDVGGTPLWRRRRFWLAGGGILAGLAALAALAPRASAYRALTGHGFGGHGRDAFGAQVLKDPAAAKQHAGMAVEWVLRGVNATDEQKQQAKRISDRRPRRGADPRAAGGARGLCPPVPRRGPDALTEFVIPRTPMPCHPEGLREDGARGIRSPGGSFVARPEWISSG